MLPDLVAWVNLVASQVEPEVGAGCSLDTYQDAPVVIAEITQDLISPIFIVVVSHVSCTPVMRCQACLFSFEFCVGCMFHVGWMSGWISSLGSYLSASSAASFICSHLFLLDTYILQSYNMTLRNEWTNLNLLSYIILKWKTRAYKSKDLNGYE